ncbi:Abi family protein [Chitinispirillales bacterium ANBcel5]|nr:Abi family protein [Chitinispirillales bacterium ANBcel5]
MKYTKPPLTFEAQADLLLERGLIADRTTLIKRLESVSYYRLSGYLFPFRKSDDSYKSGTNFEPSVNATPLTGSYE